MKERTIIGASSGGLRYFIKIGMWVPLLPNVILNSYALEAPCMTAVYIFDVVPNVETVNIISVGQSQMSALLRNSKLKQAPGGTERCPSLRTRLGECIMFTFWSTPRKPLV